MLAVLLLLLLVVAVLLLPYACTALQLLLLPYACTALQLLLLRRVAVPHLAAIVFYTQCMCIHSVCAYTQ